MTKKILLCFSLFFLQISTLYASTEQTILVYSADMQSLFLITSKQDSAIHINTIPLSMVLPVTCANNAPMPLSSIANEATQNCLQQTLVNGLSINIKQYAYLDLTKIEKDYPLTSKHQNLSGFSDFQAYFSELGSQLNSEVIWNYNSYVRTNLSFMDLYEFYTMYTSENFKLSYGFLNLYDVHQEWIPLERTFYTVDTE